MSLPIEIRKSKITEKDIIKKDITSGPIDFKLNSEGSIIVDKVEANGKVLKITYRKSGVTLSDPFIVLYDKDGNEISQTGFEERSVNRETGAYVMTLKFYNDNKDISKIAKLGMYPEEFKVLKEQGVKIPLK